MSRRYPVAARLWLAALTALVASLWVTTPHAPAQGPRAAKWEYCELEYMFALATKAKRVRLHLPAEEVEVKAFKDLGEKLRHIDLKDTSVAALNALGADGWELVSAVEYYADNDNARILVRIWTFKRPK